MTHLLTAFAALLARFRTHEQGRKAALNEDFLESTKEPYFQLF